MKDVVKKMIPKKYLLIMRKFLNGNYLYILWLLPIQKNKVVICNFYGKGYGDNSKYIAEELLKQNSKHEIVWLLKSGEDSSSFHSNIRIVKYATFRALYELATAKVWIDNCRKEFFPPKRKSQKYIQTWHSPLRLKKIEKDAINHLSFGYIEKAKKDSQMCDLMISGCDTSTKIYKDSFWYDGDILQCGTPRCDIFFNNQIDKKDILKKLNIKNDEVNILLYAPTFRSDGNFSPYISEYDDLLAILNKRFGGDWVILVRFHPNLSNTSLDFQENNKVLNVTNYNDMQELLYISDILITDYSSCMFDIAIAKKICFLYGSDVEKYLSEERELYFDLNDLPFDFFDEKENLLKAISNFDNVLYESKLNKFYDEMNFYEQGKASSILSTIITQYIK